MAHSYHEGSAGHEWGDGGKATAVRELWLGHGQLMMVRGCLSVDNVDVHVR